MIGAVFTDIKLRLLVLTACVQSLIHRAGRNSKNFHIGFVTEEFFHKDLRGFGGFGKTVKNISDHYNQNGSFFKIDVLLSQSLPLTSVPAIKRFHNASVLLRPKGEESMEANFLRYSRLIGALKTKLFMTIDYYPTYEKLLTAAPTTPIVVWIRDPRGAEEWGKLATVPLELKQRNKRDKENLQTLAVEKEDSIKRVMKLSQSFNRKFIFVSNGNFLIDRAKRTYGLNDIRPHILMNPIPTELLGDIRFSQRPSLAFLGRLDAQKRFWVVLELAKRFPHVDFLMGGDTHAPELMNPIIEKYRSQQNIKFLGLVDGKKKDEILKNCWALINTSIHEGLPVSFLETFAFGKCVISCLNPEGLVEKYGYFTGEFEGNGLDEKTLNVFSQKINLCLKDEKQRLEKGRQARRYIEENHTFEVFENRLKEILREEKILK